VDFVVTVQIEKCPHFEMVTEVKDQIRKAIEGGKIGYFSEKKDSKLKKWLNNP